MSHCVLLARSPPKARGGTGFRADADAQLGVPLYGTGVARKPWTLKKPILANCPTIWPTLLIPKATVLVAPGTSSGVKVVPSKTKPWLLKLASPNPPTIWPTLLIPEATVPVAPGTSSGVKVAPSKTKPWTPRADGMSPARQLVGDAFRRLAGPAEETHRVAGRRFVHDLLDRTDQRRISHLQPLPASARVTHPLARAEGRARPEFAHSPQNRGARHARQPVHRLQPAPTHREGFSGHEPPRLRFIEGTQHPEKELPLRRHLSSRISRHLTRVIVILRRPLSAFSCHRLEEPPPNHPETILDHFLCYEATDLSPAPATIQLRDQFDQEGQWRTATVGNARTFCNPVAKRYKDHDRKILNQDHHLVGYDVEVKGGQESVRIDNQITSYKMRDVDLGKALWLLAPARKFKPREHPEPKGLAHSSATRPQRGRSSTRP